MKRIVLISIFIFVFATGLLVSSKKVEAVYPIDFGGRIVFLFPCVNGLWTTVAVPQMVTPIPPVATFIPTMYFYVPGYSSEKLYLMPTHPGQSVLGKAFGFMLCWVPCPFGLCPIGGGFLVSPIAGSSPI